jgi:hypothetical protein
MKSLIITAAAALFISMGLGSCAKCETCSKSGSDTVRVCQSDYNSNTGYGLKIDYYKSLGYTCKNSP